jgi:HlyD family secretion protein
VKAVTVLLVTLVLLAACSRKPEAEETTLPAPVQVTAVKRQVIHRIVEADAVLYPLHQSDIMSKISAPVQQFYADRGDHVRAGQLLAALENRDLKATAAANQGQLAQAQSNLRNTEGAAVPEQVVRAQADVKSAQQDTDAALKLLNSRRRLFEQGALARRLVDEAQVAYINAAARLETNREHLRAFESVGRQEQIRAAQAQVETARGNLQNSEAQVSYSEIRSPNAGVVAERPLHTGDMASTGQPLFVIMDITRIVARANVPVGQSYLVRVGDPSTVRTADGGIELRGKVTVVSPATDPAATTVQVWVQADNPRELLKPGTVVRVAIVAATIPNAAVVPSAAIVPGENGENAVMTVRDNVAHLKPVELGARENGMVEIVKGVSPGERVITVGAIGLENDAKVRIVQPGGDNAAETGADRNGEEK